ncbi:MAG: hypothetical protein FJY80_04325 [Candidatus Aminicenantes bacterium]|nr:hypothetical protein [Candidatus Aminicenantes bacterium]
MNGVLGYLLEAGLGLALFYSGYWLFLKKETYFHWNRLYLIAALPLAFLLPFLRLTSPFLAALPAKASPEGPPIPAVGPSSFGWEGLLLAVYFGGVLACLVRFGAHLVRLAVVVRRSGVRRSDGLKVVTVDEDFSPFSFLGYIFINERGLGRDALGRILAHELVHIRQLHSLDVLLMELVAAVQWFNPFVWPYKKSLQETHEYLADAGVIAQGFSPAAYRLLLFEQHVGAQLFEFANNFKHSQVKRRILMMSKAQSGGAAKLKLLLVVPLAALLALAFADPRPARSAQQANGAPAAEKAVLKAKIESALKDLSVLKEKEALLRSKLEETTDAETKKELKTKLSEVLKKEELVVAFLESNGALPRLANSEKDLQLLAEKEAKLRQMIEHESDAAKKADLKAKLETVLAKQAELKAHNGGALVVGKEVTVESLKEESNKLKQKEADVRTMIADEKDAQKKAELETLLQKILQKQAEVKAKAESLKAAKTEKTVR